MIRMIVVLVMLVGLPISVYGSESPNSSIELLSLKYKLKKLRVPLPSMRAISTTIESGRSVVTLRAYNYGYGFTGTLKTVAITYLPDTRTWRATVVEERQSLDWWRIFVFLTLLGTAVWSLCWKEGGRGQATRGMVLGIVIPVITIIATEPFGDFGAVGRNFFFTVVIIWVLSSRALIILKVSGVFVGATVLWYMGEQNSWHEFLVLVSYCGIAIAVELGVTAMSVLSARKFHVRGNVS